ncbi:uncharacterized protein Z520_10651 [Fonsecaea multimorphosa CBS 102226]|uniref:FAD-binding domain-containing protein n=1 Tax=Fonsecaea multimorphosa CBS 102226 TaxID=1442371 RepID=A0A0D2GVU1_9EURO|nr:uncharacterized protein Z520_10651 [Fonsecaea multimorphosa CBS 102226]KIX93745.1 hypothetical protein Z520_10651 [Fonsecaea multimorphosa CBS 102226]OAL19851.1 hypothetical protein AYO22_09378 [Fonsecaea multimorphosa]
MADLKDHYDVVICGGGPVGLLTAYGLQRMGIETCVVERLEKQKLPMYGRAATLLPRTLEMLDQYDLLTHLRQEGFVTRSGVNYDKDGRRDNTRGLRSVFDAMQGQTFLNYVLNIRLKYTEDIVKAEYEKIGGLVAGGWEVMGLTTQIDQRGEGRPVKVEVKNVNTLETRALVGDYLVGADGARSTVRHLSGVASIKDSSTLRWVRIDGVVETDMPDSRQGFATLESPIHGQVLFAALDHGTTRVGFSLSQELMDKYGENMTLEQVVEEAKLALKPFTLDFKCVDWYTVYNVRHSLADTFVKDRILLAGDACHSHSSGTAQGMNTGVHDSFNLTWKLAGVLKGWYHASILETYNGERRPIAQQLIDLDKTFSKLISGTVPPELVVARGGLAMDPNVLLAKVLEDNIQFTIGLGIGYGKNALNVTTKSATLPCGRRAPDVAVHAPGASIPTRLQTVMKNVGLFWVVVFAGEPLLTGEKVRDLRGYLDGDDSMTKRHANKMVFLTIIAGNKPQADEALGVSRFGDAYYDHDSSAHDRYGVSVERGAVVVIRPDGIVGFATALESGPDLGEYFARFLL